MAFNPNPSSFVNAIALQADGKVLVGGDLQASVDSLEIALRGSTLPPGWPILLIRMRATSSGQSRFNRMEKSWSAVHLGPSVGRREIISRDSMPRPVSLMRLIRARTLTFIR